MDRAPPSEAEPEQESAENEGDVERYGRFARHEEIGQAGQDGVRRQQRECPRSNREVVLVDLDVAFVGELRRENEGGSSSKYRRGEYEEA